MKNKAAQEMVRIRNKKLGKRRVKEIAKYASEAAAKKHKDGFGVPPKPNCRKCKGRGFVYVKKLAQTCVCKLA